MAVVVPARLRGMRRPDPVTAAIVDGDPSVTMKEVSDATRYCD